MIKNTKNCLIRQKLIKNARNVLFCRVFENLNLAVKQYYQTNLIEKNLVENVK